MRGITELLKEEHRALEERLDALQAAIASGREIAEDVLLAADAARKHYSRERPFLECLARYEPQLSAKLQAQHDDACEIAHHFQQALEGGHTIDMWALARRFYAMAQHNVIEEERDAFPLAVRCFTEREQNELTNTLASRGLRPNVP